MLTRRQIGAGLVAGAIIASAPGLVVGDELKIRDLPKPRLEGGMPLMAALKARRSAREFASRGLPEQQLADLLWSAFGVNRPGGERTAPAWRHIFLVEIYAAMADGVWHYDAPGHRLLPVLGEDIRALTGTQDFVGSAPLNLVYVGRGDLMGGVAADEKQIWAAANTGFIGQNVYLYCAGEGLATVFRASVDRGRLAKALRLPEQHFVVAAQSVGHPKA